MTPTSKPQDSAKVKRAVIALADELGIHLVNEVIEDLTAVLLSLHAEQMEACDRYANAIALERSAEDEEAVSWTLALWSLAQKGMNTHECS